jgi:hypothetical protein
VSHISSKLSFNMFPRTVSLDVGKKTQGFMSPFGSSARALVLDQVLNMRDLKEADISSALKPKSAKRGRKHLCRSPCRHW